MNKNITNKEIEIKEEKLICVDNEEREYKSKKKKGFTLIEVIAVIAIIGILAVAFLPKVTGYIKEAKKVKVVEQCKNVIMAVESYNLRHDTPISKTTVVSDLKTNKGVNKYLEDVTLSNLPTNTSVQNCYDIINGAEFEFAGNTEVLNSSTIAASGTTGQSTNSGTVANPGTSPTSSNPTPSGNAQGDGNGGQ